MRGFAALPVIIITAVLVIAGAGFYFYSSETPTQPSESAVPSPTVEASPSMTATPSASLKATPIPTKKATAIPTPTPSPSAIATPAPSQASASCMTSNELGNLVVYIQSLEGPVVGDAAVTMSNGKGGDCPAVDSRLPYVQVISQGSRSVTFSGYRIGNYHVTLSYHGKNYDSAVEIKPGDNPISFNVSN